MENGTTTDKLNTTYKKYLKDLISEKIENVSFKKHTHKNKVEQLIAKNQSETISQVTENSPTERDLKTMWNAVSEFQRFS